MVNDCDIIVVGGGHAGCEAALAAARMGIHTVLITIDPDTIAQMPCNPAIGGLAKGQLVREIDALGGEMAKVIDATGIQFRMLNTSKGPAVRSPRAQADKYLYKKKMRRRLEAQENLTICQDTVDSLLTRGSARGSKITGVVGGSGAEYRADAVIITTGTFLKGLVHIGDSMEPGGRAGEPSAENLSDSLRAIGLQLGRLKTGTPPRLDRKTIPFEELTPQYGDKTPQPFSFSTAEITQPQIPCHITFTNPGTHRIIRDNLNRSPLYTGQIKGTGPRYCPSIEDKISRFADKDAHQIFIEPEGIDSDEVYCNGISTSLPPGVQEEFVHSIRGLERARIVRHGYAVEYDFVPPTQVKADLETKAMEGLFLAGQINGTSGYEEAAAQGIMAGINAALKLQGKPPFILDRSEAYIGVLIDDLVTKGTLEPYRMFTSRAEYRLILRQDNADRRLMRYGHQFGLISDPQWQALEEKESLINQTRAYLRENLYRGESLEKILRKTETHFDHLTELGSQHKLQAMRLPQDVREQVEIEVKYEGYIQRQLAQVERFKKMETLNIPSWLDYGKIPELANEARQKLSRVRPASLGQASRISGISPADVSILLVYLRGKAHRG